MKFNISVDKFVNNLTKLSLVIPVRSSLPILDDVLFQLKGKTLVMQTTDLENYIRAKVEVDGIEDGVCAVPGKKLLDLARLMLAKFDNVIISEKFDKNIYEKLADNLSDITEIRNALKYDFNSGELYYKGFMQESEKNNIINLLNESLNAIDEDNQAEFAKLYSAYRETVEKIFTKSKEQENKILSKKRIKIETNDKGKMNIASSTGKYSYYGLIPEDFPFPTDKDDLNKIVLSGSVLRRNIDKVKHTASKDDVRKNMSGILLDFRKDEIRYVATDGFRLGKITQKNFSHNNPNDDKILIPYRAAETLSKLIDPSECVLEYDNTMMKVTSGNLEIYCKLIDESFPNYETVIPKSNDKKLKISKRELINTLRRISIFVDKGTKRAKFKIKSSVMNVNAENPELGAEGEEELDCSFVNVDDSEADFDHEPFEISFNVEYLLECLLTIDTDEIIISFGTPYKAAIVYPAEQENNMEQLELIMPIRVG